MDREKIKLIVKNMELLVDALKNELLDDELAPENATVVPYQDDYDEVFVE